MMGMDLFIVVASGLVGAGVIVMGMYVATRIWRALPFTLHVVEFVRTHDKLALVSSIPLWGILFYFLFYAQFLKRLYPS